MAGLKKITADRWVCRLEIRSNISSGRTARVIFVLLDDQMVLLHLARRRKQEIT
jgi:hypothetical protein